MEWIDATFAPFRSTLLDHATLLDHVAFYPHHHPIWCHSRACVGSHSLNRTYPATHLSRALLLLHLRVIYHPTHPASFHDKTSFCCVDESHCACVALSCNYVAACYYWCLMLSTTTITTTTTTIACVAIKVVSSSSSSSSSNSLNRCDVCTIPVTPLPLPTPFDFILAVVGSHSINLPYPATHLSRALLFILRGIYHPANPASFYGYTPFCCVDKSFCPCVTLSSRWCSTCHNVLPLLCTCAKSTLTMRMLHSNDLRFVSCLYSMS